jgi:hypothetical protein
MQVCIIKNSITDSTLKLIPRIGFIAATLIGIALRTSGKNALSKQAETAAHGNGFYL